MSSKICKKCNIKKDETLFIKGKNCCKECNKLLCKLYKENNKEKVSEYNKKYKQENKEELSEYNSTYHQEHKERAYERHAVNVKKYKEKKKNDVEFKKMDQMRSTVRTFLKGETKTNKYIGCTRDFLLKWISYNDPSYTLETYGMGGWCLDHVIPCCKFSLEENLKCFNWTNVRPLSISKNSKKHRYLKKEDLDNHMAILNKFIEDNKELILKENIVVVDFDRYQYLDNDDEKISV